MDHPETTTINLTDILGIKQDASVGRGGEVISLMSNLDTVDDDTINLYRADFLRVRLRGQIPNEVDPAFLAIQSSAAVSDAMAVAAGFAPPASDLHPFVTLKDINDQPTPEEVEAGLDNPMMRATIRLAFDYVVATRFHTEESVPDSREAYEGGLKKTRRLIANWLLTDIIGRNSLNPDNMSGVTHVVDDAITTWNSTRDEKIAELISTLEDTFDIPNDVLDHEEAWKTMLLTADVETDGEESMLKIATDGGFSEDTILDLVLMLFAIRAELIDNEDPLEQFQGAIFDAFYFMIGLERPSESKSFEYPTASFSPNRSKKVRNAAAERYLDAHLQYAITQVFLSEHNRIIPQRILLASRSSIIKMVKEQIRENATNDNLAHISSDNLYAGCVMEVTSVLNKIWPRTAAAQAARS